MTKYTIHSVVHNQEKFFCVYEKMSNQVIDYFLFEDDANSRLEELERGKGFDGFTPAFILNTDHVKKLEINSQFRDILEK